MDKRSLQAVKKFIKTITMELFIHNLISGDTVKKIFDKFKLKAS